MRSCDVPRPAPLDGAGVFVEGSIDIKPFEPSPLPKHRLEGDRQALPETGEGGPGGREFRVASGSLTWTMLLAALDAQEDEEIQSNLTVPLQYDRGYEKGKKAQPVQLVVGLSTATGIKNRDRSERNINPSVSFIRSRGLQSIFNHLDLMIVRSHRHKSAPEPCCLSLYSCFFVRAP